MNLTEKEKEILKIMLDVWIDCDMPLYGYMSYEDAKELLEKLGINTLQIDQKLERFKS